MKTIFVTGGAGFIGSNFLINQIKKGNTKVINYDKLTYAGNLDTLSSIESDPNYFFIKGDICNQKLVYESLIKHQVECVVNFAAESHVDRSIESPGEFIQTNIVGTFKLLQAARDYQNDMKLHEEKKDLYKKFRFLHVSTDEVYGSLGDSGFFTEKTPYAPNSPYAASKASSDHLIRSYFKTFGLPTITTNCSNNYGPHQFPEKLIPLMIQKAITGKSLPIYGDGLHIRDWLYVDDHCHALAKVLEKGKPGEPDGYGPGIFLYGGTVIRIGDEFRMWYIGFGEEEGVVGGRICYAVSKDGVNWTKPSLGLVKFNGNTQNNLVLSDSDYSTKMTCILVLHEPDDPEPNRRFKLIKEVTPFHTIAAFSPDGLNWKDSPHNPILKHNTIEPGGLMKFNGCYYLTGQGGNVGSKRALVTYMSYDFDHWSDAVPKDLDASEIHQPHQRRHGKNSLDTLGSIY